MNATRFQRVLTALLSVSISTSPAIAGPLVYQVPMNGTDMSQPTAGRLSLTPAVRDFGTVILGGSAGVSVVVKNDGQDSVTLSAIDATAPFSQANNCPTTLVGGASCSMSVTFVPVAAGDFTGSVTLQASSGTSTMSLSGRAVVPTTNLGLSMASVDMGASNVGVTASVRQLTITNNGNSPATVTGIGVSSGGSDFSQSNGCGSTLAPGGSCTVNVSFTPSTYGSRIGNLSVYEEVSETLYSVSLQGFGNAAVLALSPASVTFPDTVADYPSTRKVTVTNTGNLPVSSLATAVSGSTEFSITDSACTPALAAGASCDVTVSFNPATAGNKTASLNVTSANTASHTVALAGKGEAQAPAVTADLGSFAFLAQVVGSPPTSRTVQLTNSGNVPVTVSGLSVVLGASDYSQTNNCASLPVGASCSVTVQFSPTARGDRDGAVFLQYGTNTLTVPITGRGLQGVVSLSRANVDFSNVKVAQAAGAQAVTLTNTGDAVLHVSNVSLPNGTDFTVASPCASVDIGASCTITVNFTPSSLGLKSATVSIASDAASTVSLPVSGTGVKGQAATSASTLNFTAQQVSTTSPVQTVTVTNTGTTVLNFTGVSVIAGSADFAQSNDCASVAVNGTCTVNVSFTPSASGARTGTVALAHDGDGVTTIALNGDARAQTATLAAPTFASQQVATGANATATLTNTGVGALAVTAPAAGSVTGSDFSFVSTTCGTSVPVGGTCSVTVRFTPSATGARTGSLVIATGAGSKTVTLSGTGMQGTASVSASSLTYAAQQVSSTSAAQTVTVTNTGTNTLSFTGVGIASGSTDFAQSNNCATVPVNGTCTVTVTFTPSTSGARSGTLALTHDGSGVTTVSLSGTGQVQSGSLSTPSFSNTPVGSSSTATATLSNTGIGALTVTVPTAGSVTGTDFSFVSTTCGTSVAVGGNCVVTVRFNPSSTTARSGTLSVATGGGAFNVTLGSTGIQGYASVSPSSLTFANRQTGTTSAAQTVTVTNTGTNTLTFTGVGISEGTADFAQSNNCASVAVNGTCTINVSFTPSAAGARNGTLALTHNGGGIATVSLSGSGQVPSATITSNAYSNTQVGSSSTGTQTITNTGVGPVSFPGGVTVNAPFAWVSSTCPATLNAGQSCVATLSFSPTAAQAYTQTLTVPTSAGNLTSTSTGVGVAASLVLTSSANLGTSMTPRTDSGSHLTYQNNGVGNVTITGTPSATGSVSYYAPASASYCYNGLVLAPGGTCQVWANVNQVAGSYSGTISVPSTAGTVNTTVTATVVGGLGVSTVAYGDVAAGSTKDMTVTVSNTAAWTSRNMTYSATAPFSIVTNNCGTTIAANSSCTMTVRFTASGTTAVNGNYVTATGAYARIRQGNIEETAYMGASVSANGVMSGRSVYAALAYAPTSLSFGNVQIGQSSAQNFTITNTGNITATGLAGIQVSGFSVSPSGATPCGGSLAAGASCTATATFTPTAAQAYSGNYGSSGTNITTAYLPVSGTGVNPSVALSSVSGGNAMGVVGVLSDSGRWPVFVNNGIANVTITGHSVNNGNFWAWQGDSGNQGTCYIGKVLTPGATCTTFVGVNTGSIADHSTTETLSYRGAGASSDRTVTQAYSASVRTTTADRSSIAFGTVPQNQWNGPVYVRITNNATNNVLRNLTVGISGSNAGNFTIGGYTCSGGGLSGGQYCDIPVYFNPTWSANGFSATLNIRAGYPRMDPNETTYIPTTGVAIDVALSGNGAYSQATALDAAAKDFGGGWYGQTASQLNWVYRNDGNVAMTLNPPALSAPLSVASNNCSNVAPGAQCNILINNAWNNDSAPTSQSWTLTGATVAPATVTAYYTVYSAVPVWGNTNLAFGNVTLGSSSTLPVTLYNYGAHTPYNWAANNSIANLPADFSVNLSGCSSVAAGPGSGQQGGSCTAYVTFTPTVAGSRGGSSVYVAAASYGVSSTWATFSGTGVAAAPVFTSTAAPTSTATTNQTGTSRTHTITWTFSNPAGYAQTPSAVTAIQDSGSHTSVYVDTAASSCKVGTAVGAGGSCTVVVKAGGPLCASGVIRASVTTPGGVGYTSVPRTISSPCG